MESASPGALENRTFLSTNPESTYNIVNTRTGYTFIVSQCHVKINMKISSSDIALR